MDEYLYGCGRDLEGRLFRFRFRILKRTAKRRAATPSMHGTGNRSGPCAPRFVEQQHFRRGRPLA
jgi:hypothetical protein